MGKMREVPPPGFRYVSPPAPAPAPAPAVPEPMGYQPKSVSVSIGAGRTINQNICLSMVRRPSVPSPPPPRIVVPPPKPGTGDISGYIKDPETQRYLGDVLLSLNGQQIHSQGSGYYHLDDILAGAYRLEAELEGYNKHTWSVKVRASDDIKHDIALVRIKEVVFKLPLGKWQYVRMAGMQFDMYVPSGERYLVDYYLKTLEENRLRLIKYEVSRWVRLYGGAEENYITASYSL